MMINNLEGFRRINYYGSDSFNICDDTVTNRTILENNNITYTAHSFISADGSRVTRLEF